MDMVSVIISLISGIIGGNVAGAAMPADKNLGALGNSISGFFGGGISSYIMQALGILGTIATTATTGTAAAPGTEMDISHLIANIGGSGVGGAILTAIVGYIKSSLQKPS